MLIVTAKVLNYVEEMRTQTNFYFQEYSYNMLPLFLKNSGAFTK